MTEPVDLEAPFGMGDSYSDGMARGSAHRICRARVALYKVRQGPLHA